MKKNVLLIIATLSDGGAERVASRISLELSKSCNLYLILFNSSNIKFPYGGQLIDLNIPARKGLINKAATFIKRVYSVKKAKKILNIHASLSLMEGANFVNILSRCNDKIFVSVRTFKSKLPKNIYYYFDKFFIKLFYNRANAVVAVSRAAAADMVNNFSVHSNISRFIYNPYDINRIRMLCGKELDAENENLFRHPVIITSGRYNEAKGQWHLIRAFSEVKRYIKSANLIILGQGELEEYLKSLVNGLDMKECVHFLGYKENPFNYIYNSSVFVLSSTFEGFPNVLAEAMVCGVPVISADCRSGPREILAPDTDFNLEAKEIEYEKYGILVPVCDGHKYSSNDPLTKEELILAESIINLLNNKEMQDKYRKLSLLRANDFKNEIIIKEYKKLLLED